MTLTSTAELYPTDQNPNEEQNGLRYCLVHGSWHGGWCWDLVRPELETRGHEVQTPTLPIEEEVTFDELADFICKDIQSENETIVALHSRMGNLGPRIAARLAVRKLVFINAGFEPGTRGPHWQNILRRPPPKYSRPGFHRQVISDTPKSGRMVFNPEKIVEYFYHDCPPELIDWILPQLRPQYRNWGAPVWNWPKVEWASVLGTKDRVINPNYSRHVATHWLGVNAVELSGGHSLFFSKPAELAETLHEAGKDKVQQNQ